MEEQEVKKVEHAYARPWGETPRQLERADLLDMNLPERFHLASFRDMDRTVHVLKELPGSDKPIKSEVENVSREFIQRYLSRLRDMRSAGMGVIFNGPNGTGKTYAACVLLKAFRMHGQSCTYAHAETFRRSLFSDEVVDLSGRPLRSRCFDADVLLLDDLGKEVKSTKSGHELYAFENLIRERYSRNKVTLYTTNMSSKRLKEAYKVSTISVLEGNTTMHTMIGVNKRVGANSELRDFLKGPK